MMDSCYSGIQVSFSGQILLNLRVIWKQHDNDEICIGKHRLGHISCLVRSPRMMVGNVRAKKPPPTSFMTSLIVIGFISMTMISGFCCFLSPKFWFPLSMQVTSLKTGYPKSAFSLWQIAAWLWKWDDFFPSRRPFTDNFFSASKSVVPDFRCNPKAASRLRDWKPNNDFCWEIAMLIMLGVYGPFWSMELS